MSDLRDDIQAAINRNSAENGSNTPDHILADYLLLCLVAYDRATKRRDGWYDVHPYPGWRGAHRAQGEPDDPQA